MQFFRGFFFLVLNLSKTSEENPAKHYRAHIWTLDSCRPLLPSSGPAAAPPPCSRGRARPASDWLSQGVGVAAASCCGWSSTSCSAQWALGASWACTPSTLLRRKRGGGNNTRRGGKKEISVHKHNRFGSGGGTEQRVPSLLSERKRGEV